MSFFGIGKSKKGTNTALPAASRDITSSQGNEKSFIPTANGVEAASKASGERGRGTPAASNNASANTSFNSLQDMSNESKSSRSMSDPDRPSMAQGRSRSGTTGREADLYPWSSRRINFTTTANPFPRYGAAVNSMASKDGMIYMMGGLINGATVKGDLWIVEGGSANLACYPVATTSEGPGPRVGHASLLVGNAFIVFGGDTKVEESDILDDTLYLLNTATKQWSRALPAGPRPAGRYGHTLNILGSKIYIFGGQVEGFFFNDLVAFDLNQLQSSTNRWEVLITTDKDGVSAQGPVPPPRTNHSMVTYNDKLYLFGGTDGVTWFNDVWTYDPRTNHWTELDCIGYIPAPREGHAACIVNDTMYIFGGRVQEGTDLGDLAAFRIPSRRWYMFQNMGMSPSPRSGHSMTAFGKNIVCLAGEPSSARSDPGELSLAYVLDTSKIRYPPNEPVPPPQGQIRKLSTGDRSERGTPTGIPQNRSIPQPIASNIFNQGAQRNDGPPGGPPGSRLPRPGMSSTPSGPPPGVSGPPPAQQLPQPRPSKEGARARSGSRSRTPTERGYGPPIDTSSMPNATGPVTQTSPTQGIPPQARGLAINGGFPEEQTTAPPTGLVSGAPAQPSVGPPVQASIGPAMPPTMGPPPTAPPITGPPAQPAQPNGPPPRQASLDETPTPTTTNSSRSGSRAVRQQASIDSSILDTPRASGEEPSRHGTAQSNHIDSGVGSSPAIDLQHDELARELEAAKSRNAWLASELALARKAGYSPNASSSPVLDRSAAELFGDDDRPLIEALLRMRAELAAIQNTMDGNAEDTAKKIAAIEKQRDSAINEAAYAKAKLAAHGGSPASTPQPDSARSQGTPDNERMTDVSKKLAAALAAQGQAQSRLDRIAAELEAERRARAAAEDTAESAHKRITELESNWEAQGTEMESLKAELHEAQRVAREEAANSNEARSSSRLLQVDKDELVTKHSKAMEEIKSHAVILTALREAVNASSDKASLLERKLEAERQQRETVVQKLAQLKSEHEARTSELETTSRRLRDAEELAERNAAEAKTHRDAMLSGLARATERDEVESDAVDERVTILTQQVEAANAMVQSNREAADQASERLRRAEERVAGLERYQEQTSRESLSMRQKLQATVRELQALHGEKSELSQQLERYQLESNASEVQLKTVKDLLEERGMSPAEMRRSRILDSPNMGNRLGTPDLNRAKALEEQLEAQLKSSEELRNSFEADKASMSKEFADKLGALETEHQGLVKYVRGLEKMLAKMKQELQRSKTANTELENQLSQQAQSHAAERNAPAEWQTERDRLRAEITEIQNSVQSTVAALESKAAALQSSLTAAEQQRSQLEASARSNDQERAQLQQSFRSSEQARQQLQSEHDAFLRAHAEHATELERLHTENLQLEERARDAEEKVQLFLDRFESSVDNYRRSLAPRSGQNGISGMGGGLKLGGGMGHKHHLSTGAESIYSTATDVTDTTETDPHGDNELTPTHQNTFGNTSTFNNSQTPFSNSQNWDLNSTLIGGENEGSPHGRDRSSTALDSLASELDALRAHWETSKSHRISREAPFSPIPEAKTPGGNGGGESLVDWRKRLGVDDDEDDHVGSSKS